MREDQAAGETEAGSAGTQLARDSRPGLRRRIAGGSDARLFPQPQRSFGAAPPMPQKIQTDTGFIARDGKTSKLNCLSQKPGTLHHTSKNKIRECGQFKFSTVETLKPSMMREVASGRDCRMRCIILCREFFFKIVDLNHPQPLDEEGIAATRSYTA